jgi:putative phosphoesterase
MRVAAIYDIHGNLAALEAVLREIESARVDLIVVGGDVVPGPMPGETLHRLLEIDGPVQCIRGNGEREVLAMAAGNEPTTVPPRFRPVIQWTADQLSAPNLEIMRTWPAATRIDMPAHGRVLFCHATPRSDVELFTRLTPVDRLLPVFEAAKADLVVCGHTHMQFDRAIGSTRVVNAGSVGMPFGDPGACWLLIDRDIELRRTTYDLEDAVRRIRESPYPQAEEFALRSVLQPPSESEMLEIYSNAATPPSVPTGTDSGS